MAPASASLALCRRLLLAAGLALPSAAAAQMGALLVVVSDSGGRLLSDVEVTASSGKVTRSDSAGVVLFPALPPGQHDFTFRRIGYITVKKMYTILDGVRDTIWIVLPSQAVQLAAMDIKDEQHDYMKGFEERRAKGIGMFITRADIDKANTVSASDLFRMVPQVHLVHVFSGWGIRVPTNIDILSGPRMCTPMVWLDGQRAPGMEIDDIRATDIQGIEFYRGASVVPGQFSGMGTTSCGVVLVWTRRRK